MEYGLFLARDVAERLGVRPHQLNYAIWSGRLPEPHLRIRNMRLWDEDEVSVARTYFEKKKIHVAETQHQSELQQEDPQDQSSTMGNSTIVNAGPLGSYS